MLLVGHLLFFISLHLHHHTGMATGRQLANTVARSADMLRMDVMVNGLLSLIACKGTAFLRNN